MATRSRTDAALERAERFLVGRLREGRYGLSCHGSDGDPRFSHEKGHVFAGFFLAEALVGRLTESDRSLLLARIRFEERQGLWGYSPPAPDVGREREPFLVDADDTAFVLRTCRLLGAPRPVEPLLRFFRPTDRWWKRLASGGRARGGFTTFTSPRRSVRLVTEPSVGGNLEMHPEVNANVFATLRGTELEQIIDYRPLRSAQALDGHWPAYFYPGRFWGTAMALELWSGRAADAAAGREARDRAIGFLAATQAPEGSWGEPPDPYETALAARALLAAGAHLGAVAQAGRFLLDRQLSDGSWSSERVIWRFHETDDDVWSARDSHRVLTTALCFDALKRSTARQLAHRPQQREPVSQLAKSCSSSRPRAGAMPRWLRPPCDAQSD